MSNQTHGKSNAKAAAAQLKHGSAAHQVKLVMDLSGIVKVGEKRHDWKTTARALGAKKPDELAKCTPITSSVTQKVTTKAAVSFVDFCKKNKLAKSVLDIQPEHIKAYAEWRIENGDKRNGETLSYSTLNGELAALRTFQCAVAAVRDGKQWEPSVKSIWDNGISEARKSLRQAFAEGKLYLTKPARAYNDPKALVEAFSGDFQIVAKIQYEGGARISEAHMVKREQLQGLRKDPATGEMRGYIFLPGEVTKGGKPRTISIAEDTYLKLSDRTAKGPLYVNERDYRGELKNACWATGQEYDDRSSHGLRWSFAQERMQILQENGIDYPQALREVSFEMGHERASITKHYLRRL